MISAADSPQAISHGFRCQAKNCAAKIMSEVDDFCHCETERETTPDSLIDANQTPATVTRSISEVLAPINRPARHIAIEVFAVADYRGAPCNYCNQQ
jgi:hypothetical protein